MHAAKDSDSALRAEPHCRNDRMSDLYRNGPISLSDPAAIAALAVESLDLRKITYLNCANAGHGT
jgi:hypothetical protein